MKNLIAQITKQIVALKGAQFASLTYLSKKSGELARYTANFNFSYHEIVVKSKTELELLMVENADKWDAVYKEAAAKILASLNKTLTAHANGQQNEDYTKKDQYIPLGGGANLNTTDNTIQLFGLVKSKVVLVPGTFETVNSKPVTIARRKIEKMLPIGNFREFALDVQQVAQAKINGNTFEMEPTTDNDNTFEHTVNPPTPATAPISV